MPNLHSRIKQNRKRLGLSQSDLAEKCGVSQPTVANWERGGHIPRQEALKRIAENLGVDSVWLISGEMPVNQSPAFQYLNTPIRHVPIYNWFKNARNFSTALPIRYASVATESDDVFGIIAPKNSEYGEGTLLVFDRTAKIAANTRFLAQDHKELIISDAATIEGSNLLPLARLIYSVVSH
ncbi:helix-turn-helix protein [Litorimonas taeanensis]|uniref:Helix-turn-helix protein n=1 Tax=Litorimonas taeanensis TaxID=568099 RepID=A0A420WKV5_9PROT|nr:helix-turn-helix transcriptional regulator [Litorimonas taeanensis]RKQ71546.1 helix-turn-helix protein [Litorimonas taeanensis]